MKKLDKKEMAKKFYIEKFFNISSIAKTLNINRATIYYYKNCDLKKNIDWDELRYINTLNPQNTKNKEKMFLSVLITEFDKALVTLEQSNVEQKLKKLENFANSYYKLKIPDAKTNIKLKKEELVKEVITSIVDLSIKQKNISVANFLKNNSSNIIEKVFKNE